MPLYRFYRIVSTEGPEEYIGSTTYTLSFRFTAHKNEHKHGTSVTSSILFTKYGVDTCSISLISEQEMEKADAMREERRLIEESLLAVNKTRPIVEKDELRQESNERCRARYENHRIEIIEEKRKYREEHREALRVKRREKVPCDICGKLSARWSITRHKRSKSCVPPSQ